MKWKLTKSDDLEDDGDYVVTVERCDDHCARVPRVFPYMSVLRREKECFKCKARLFNECGDCEKKNADAFLNAGCLNMGCIMRLHTHCPVCVETQSSMGQGACEACFDRHKDTLMHGCPFVHAGESADLGNAFFMDSGL